MKRRWFRFVFFTFLTGFFLVAGLVAACCIFVETRPVQAFIQRQVNKTIPGTLSWEQFSLSLRKGTVQISGIHLKGVSGKKLAGISLVEATVNWSALTRHRIELAQVLIDRPVLDIGMSEQGNIDILSALVSDTGSSSDAPDSKPAQSPGLDFQVREFKINEARVKVTAPQFNTDIRQLSVEVSDFKLADLCASAKVALAGGHLGVGDMDFDLETFNVQARIDKDKISNIDINARMPGIKLNATGSVTDLLGTVVPDLSLILDVEAPLATKSLGLSGDLVRGNGRVHMTVKGDVDNPLAQIQCEFGPGHINNMAVTGIKFHAGLKDRHLTLTNSRVDLPAGTIPLGGNVDLSKTFPKGFTKTMAGLDSLAYDFSADTNNLSLTALELGENIPQGNISARVLVQGRGVMPGQMSAHADLDVTAHDLILPQMLEPARVQFTAGAELKQEHLTLTSLTIDGPGMTGTGTFRLDMPGFNPKTMTTTGNLDIDVADLSVPFSLVGRKAEGRAGVHARVQGALTLPDLTLDINGDNLASGGFKVDQALFKARMDKGVVQVQELTLKRNQGILSAAGTLALGGENGGEKSRDHALDLTVDINQLRLDELAPDLGARGIFSGKVTGSGALEKPDIRLVLSGQNPGFQTYSLGSIQAQLKFADNILTFEQAHIQKNNAHLDITGQVDTGRQTMDVRAVIPETELKGIDQAADAFLASGKLCLDVSVRGALTAPDISGCIKAIDLRLPNAPDMAADADVSMEVHGSLENPEALQASVRINRLALAKQEQALVRIVNAEARLKDGRFNLDSVPIQIMDAEQLMLRANGDINGDLEADVSGTLPVAMLVPLADGINSAQGDILISLSARGKTTSPDLCGSIEFSDMALDLQALEEPLQKIKGRIVLTPRAVEILDVTANLGDGKIKLSGTGELKNGVPDNFMIDFHAIQVPVNIPATLDMELSSQLTWAGTLEKSNLTGQIDIFEGTYYKDVDLSLLSIAAQTTKKSRPRIREPGPEFLKTIGLNIYVTRREAIAVDNNLATMSISPNLSVRGTAYAPSLDGRAVVDEGTITFQKATFEITEGAIDFINPYKIEPEITVTSETTISSYTITLSVTGTPDDLDLKFSSEPAVSDADILSLIAFGKTTGEMGSGDSEGDTVSAATIAKLLADPLSEKIKETTGLSEVSFSMEDEENGTTGVHVSLGADLSRQFSVSYGMDISDGETVQTVTTYYKLLEHLLLSGFQDTGGKFGGELKYRLEFR
ncbi:translocation/assembly module TamB domain-containing protein [uncultured Desulfobacter sp.]|uniref:translocation/assembly module TamB domain-containing protein n=1 Tax=uncultured Desulfobacter sp. TaxID=240139 RepID=UPI002AAA900F|nr:translocation/assembly module TamB domain-containing protein [uncultured Desulfobacter sp.]